MDEHLKTRIRARLAELDITMRAASLAVSTNPDLFRGVLREDTPFNPKAETLNLLAEALRVTPAWFHANSDSKTAQLVTPHFRPPPRRARPAASLDVPVRGTASGTIIAPHFIGFQMQDVIEYVPRPPGMMGVPDLYAIYVVGESMAPMHEPGALRFVHPHRPPKPGDTVIVQTKNYDEDPGQAYIKVMRRQTGERLVIEQLNPKATIEIPRQFVTSVHRVLTVNELFGMAS